MTPQPHSTRQSYQGGCACLPCRSANAVYAHGRAHATSPGWGHPDAARAYLLALQAKGIGYRQAAHLSGISATTIKAIRVGERTRILTRHHDAILAIPPYPAMGQRISSKRAKHLLRSLTGEGYTLEDIATKIDLPLAGLRLHPTITVWKCLRVQALWRKLTQEGAPA